MRTLAIETATEACSVALFEDSALLAYDHRVLGRGHAEHLVPMIAALPNKGKANRILVSLGPGSFTGVRIGVATARVLGFAWEADVLGYPTLALIAAQARGDNQVPITVCMNGGHGEFFVQNYSSEEAEGPAQSLLPAAATQSSRHNLIAGNRATELADLLDRTVEVIELLPDARDTHRLPQAAFTTDLAPIYGRGPDAVPQSQAVMPNGLTP